MSMETAEQNIGQKAGDGVREGEPGAGVDNVSLSLPNIGDPEVTKLAFERMQEMGSVGVGDAEIDEEGNIRWANDQFAVEPGTKLHMFYAVIPEAAYRMIEERGYMKLFFGGTCLRLEQIVAKAMETVTVMLMTDILKERGIDINEAAAEAEKAEQEAAESRKVEFADPGDCVVTGIAKA